MRIIFVVFLLFSFVAKADFPTALNGQITDATSEENVKVLSSEPINITTNNPDQVLTGSDITKTNVCVLRNAPAVAMGNIFSTINQASVLNGCNF